MRSILLVLFVLLLNTAYTQQSVNYFSDTFKTGANSRIFCATAENEFIYAGGQSFDSLGKPYTPSLIKLDTSGKTIWTYTVNKQLDPADYDGYSLYKYAEIRNIVLDSTDVYANMYSYYHGSELRRINKMTGGEIWKKDITYAALLTNAGNTHLIYTYYGDEGYIYELINKATGETVMTKVLNLSGEGTITVDSDGTTYISHGDSILAYTSPMLSALKWAVKTNSPASIYVLQPDSDGYIYIAGSGNAFFSGRIKKQNGEVGWITVSTLIPRYLNDYISDFKIKGNYVYASGQQAYSGSVYTSYHICKFNRITGKLSWETNYNPNTTSHGPGEPYAGTNNIIIDENDNVYATGYENAGDDKAGTWGICKFDSTGALTYHGQIFDGLKNTSFSRGVFVFELNHHIFYLGELQKNGPLPNPLYNGSYSNAFLVATDTSGSFNPYNKRRIMSTYQDFSDVKQIEPFAGDKYVVYKQIGNNAVIEMKNAKNNSLVWSRSFTKDFHSEADKMCVTADNNIYISILGYPAAEMQFDYSSYADNVYFLKIDSTGNLLRESKYSITGQHTFKSIQLYATRDTNTVFIFKNLGWYNSEYVNFFNLEKATGTLLDEYASYFSTYENLPVNQALLVPLTKDVYVSVQNRFYTGWSEPAFPLLYQLSFKNTSGPGYERSQQFSIISEKIQAHYVLPYDSTSIIILGTEKSGIDKMFLHNKNSQSNIWKNTYPVSEHADMATLVSGRIFVSGRSGNSLLIQKLNAATGSQIWQQKIAPANSGQYFMPVEQKFNDHRKQYIISGFIADSAGRANAITRQLAFYIITDTNGIIISKWIEAGDYKQQNSLKSIGIAANGNSIIGGALYKYPYGLSGVLIQIDSATVLAEDFITIKARPITNNRAEINWTITQEENIAFYEIQHSINGYSFETLGTQLPVTNAPVSHTYFYKTDVLETGTHYFRIKSIDKEGKVQLSNVAKLYLANDILEMLIKPNPSLDYIYIHLPAPVQSATFSVYSVSSGKMVKKITNITGTDLRIDISDLAAGVYIAKAEDAENTFIGRFIKL